MEGTARVSSLIKAVPLEYSFIQSTKQAFYFIESATISGKPLKEEDLIIAYNGDVIIGSRYFYGKITDVPAMGSDVDPACAGYAKPGDIITFKVLTSTGELIDMETYDNTTWDNLGMTVIQLSDKVLPQDFILSNAYPNPFNPVTTLRFAIPIDAEVSLSIYNLQGREVVSLISGNMDAGYHSIVWDANFYASGVYFVKMIAGEYISSQKLILVK